VTSGIEKIKQNLQKMITFSMNTLKINFGNELLEMK